MNCPRCNAPGAYVGLNVVECSNERCEHFKAPERSPGAGLTPREHLDLLRQLYDFGVGDYRSDLRINTIGEVARGQLTFRDCGVEFTLPARPTIRPETRAKAKARLGEWYELLSAAWLRGYLETLEREEP